MSKIQLSGLEKSCCCFCVSECLIVKWIKKGTLSKSDIIPQRKKRILRPGCDPIEMEICGCFLV